jgi:hypothetical protein
MRDDSRARHRRRGEEGRQDGDDDGRVQAHDAGVLPHRVRLSGSPRMRRPTRCRAACHLL